MCFSATSSFVSGTILGVAGLYLFSKFKKTNKIFLSLIPLFFGIQQIFEGMLWLSIPFGNTSIIVSLAKNFFLFFAYVFWPFWVPFSFYFAEAKKNRKKALKAISVIGFFIAINALFNVFKSRPSLHSFSIDYNVTILIMGSIYLYILLYTAVCVLPMFISSIRYTSSFGLVVFILGIITYAYDKNIGASLWCFFSAISSLLLIFILQKDDKSSMKS